MLSAKMAAFLSRGRQVNMMHERKPSDMNNRIYYGITWSWLSHIYASVIQILIGSDNGFLPVQHKTAIWPNVGLLLIQHMGKSFS